MLYFPQNTRLAREAGADKRVARGMLRLRAALDEQIPQRNLDQSLLLATWNIREFDSPKFGKRTEECYFYISEILSRFDIVALQEIRSDLSALNKVMERLGSWYKVIFSDTTEGTQGNGERMAFLYDSRKVQFGGLAGEVVIPSSRATSPVRQLARTPFITGFQSGWYTFMLCTVHIYYGKGVAVDPVRLEEIKALAKFLKKRATDKFAYARNLILLGDFNIFNPADVTFKALTDEGFYIPSRIQRLPSNVAQNKHYDQIAFISPDQQKLLETANAGVFNFFRYVFRDEDAPDYETLYKAYAAEAPPGAEDEGDEDENAVNATYAAWRTHQMSDHLPMWVELKTNFTNDYLMEKAE